MYLYKFWARSAVDQRETYFCGVAPTALDGIIEALIAAEKAGIHKPVIDQFHSYGPIVFGNCPACRTPLVSELTQGGDNGNGKT